MDLDDIQDGEVYAVEESKHDDGTTARLSVEADGAIVGGLDRRGRRSIKTQKLPLVPRSFKARAGREHYERENASSSSRNAPCSRGSRGTSPP